MNRRGFFGRGLGLIAALPCFAWLKPKAPPVDKFLHVLYPGEKVTAVCSDTTNLAEGWEITLTIEYGSPTAGVPRIQRFIAAGRQLEDQSHPQCRSEKA